MHTNHIPCSEDVYTGLCKLACGHSQDAHQHACSPLPAVEARKDHASMCAAAGVGEGEVRSEEEKLRQLHSEVSNAGFDTFATWNKEPRPADPLRRNRQCCALCAGHSSGSATYIMTCHPPEGP
jgi:hypothetical protein